MICAMAMIGVAILHSATFTNPEEAGLPMRQATRFGVAFVVLLVTAMVPVRWWFWAAWPSYLATLILLVGVEFFGTTGGGAQRWLQIPGLPRFQPSEVMKLLVPIVVASYFNQRSLPPKFKHVFWALKFI